MKSIFRYLAAYSTVPVDVDRLLVSAYLRINGIEVENNILIKSYQITPNDEIEFQNLEEFLLVLKNDCQVFDLESLIELFEFVISPSDRIVNGAIYTPLNIRNYLADRAMSLKSDLLPTVMIGDISCGCGGFLMTAALKLKGLSGLAYKEIFLNNIFGLDIQEFSICRTKVLLTLLAVSDGEDETSYTFNLFVGDALTFDWKANVNHFAGFDIVLGNPPYVCARNLSAETLLKLQSFQVCQSGNSDLYIPFFQLGIELLKDSGVLGFITMNSFFKSLNGRNLREYFKRKSLAFTIIDFGSQQVFKSRNTYTCICLIQNTFDLSISYCRPSSLYLPAAGQSEYGTIPYAQLNSFKGWNLNDFETISKIESTGVAFGDLYNTRHGIATLKNDIYIFNPIGEDKDYYYLKSGNVYQIEKGICRDIVNTNKLSRVVALDGLREKVIFPYDNNDKPRLLGESFIKETFPKAYNYLLERRPVLDSRDKGKGGYKSWFAFGRSQSLENVKNKLFFPKISDREPTCILSSEDNLLFYNGLAVVGHTLDEMLFLKKLMESRLFWYYIRTTSKPYSSDYYSLNGNYIKNFGVCQLSDSEMKFVLMEKNRCILDEFFEERYSISHIGI